MVTSLVFTLTTNAFLDSRCYTPLRHPHSKNSRNYIIQKPAWQNHQTKLNTSNPYSSIIIIKGELTDLDALSTAIQGVEVVLSALGPLLKTSARQRHLHFFFSHLIDLIAKHNINESTSLEQHPSQTPTTNSVKLFVAGFRFTAYNAYQDIVGIKDVIRTKGDALDWSSCMAGHVGDVITGYTLSRKGYDAFTVHEVENVEWIKEAPLASF
jgi:hypothetical protein